jgi:hypothetical protein
VNPHGAPGWYPDPDGTPGMVRWWSGSAWSDVMTPAGPGVAVRTMTPAAPPSPRPPAGPPPAAPPARPSRAPWIVGGAVLTIVAVLLIALITSGGGTPAPAPAPTLPNAAPSGPTFPQGTVRIFDKSAGISYPYLGGGWLEYDLQEQYETTTTAGQYFTTQAEVPDGGEFIAQCTSGPVAEGFGWNGPATLQTTMAALADSVRENYYPAPNQRKVLRDEARTVDGHPARLFEFDLSWHVAGYQATGERAALLLIDVGRPAPALLYISIPNTHAELYADIDQVLADVHVL